MAILDISVDELPAGRIPIKNCVVDESHRKTVPRLYHEGGSHRGIRYIVCPMVEASEVLDDVANVTEYTEGKKFIRDMALTLRWYVCTVR